MTHFDGGVIRPDSISSLVDDCCAFELIANYLGVIYETKWAVHINYQMIGMFESKNTIRRSDEMAKYPCIQWNIV